MLCKATQDGQVMVENYDKTWSTGEENGKLLQYSCLENPMKGAHMTNYWRNENQNYTEMSSHSSQIAIIKMSTNNKC